MFDVGNYTAGIFKTCLSVLLLTQSIALQAEGESATDKSTGAASVKPESVALENAGLQQEDSTQSLIQEKSDQTAVPPPPPGPYMSTALSDQTVRGSAFAHGANKQQQRRAGEEPVAGAASVDNFSPDRPWPDDLRPPKRWKPESGYQFHGTSRNMDAHVPPVHNSFTPGNYGYQPTQGMMPSGNQTQNPSARNLSGRYPSQNNSAMRNPATPANGMRPQQRPMPAAQNPNSGHMGYSQGYPQGRYHANQPAPYPGNPAINKNYSNRQY